MSAFCQHYGSTKSLNVMTQVRYGRLAFCTRRAEDNVDGAPVRCLGNAVKHRARLDLQAIPVTIKCSVNVEGI